MALNVELVTTEAELLRLQPEWDALVRRSAHASIFSTFEWAEACWRFRPEGASPFVVKLLDGPRLVGLAPLRRRGRGGPGQPVVLDPIGLGGGCWADYLDVLSASGFEEPVLRQLLAFLRTCDEWNVLDLPEMPDASPSRALLAQAIASGALRAVETASSPCRTVSLPGSWPEYLARLSSVERGTIERKTRKIVREHDARFAQVRTPAEIEPVLDAMLRFQDSRWSPARSAERADYFRFVRYLAPRMLERGWLDLRVLRLGESPIATILSFRFRKTVYYYLFGFDPDPLLSKYSPGVLLVAHALRQAIEDGFQVFDMMRGDERYKASLGAECHTNHRFRLARTSPWHWYLQGRAALARLKAAAIERPTVQAS